MLFREAAPKIRWSRGYVDTQSQAPLSFVITDSCSNLSGSTTYTADCLNTAASIHFKIHLEQNI